MQSKYEMSNGRWCSKKDVLEDLALATGRRVRNIDNSFFIVGENPPPPLSFGDEEDGMLYSNGNNVSYCNEIKPDLKGISQMLRLVKDHSGSTENIDDVKVCTTSLKKSCDIITISKLNPNVKEFIPRCSTEPSVNSSKDNVIDNSQIRTDSVNCDEVKVSDCKPSEENVREVTIDNNVILEEKVGNDLVINKDDDSKQVVDTNKNCELGPIDLKSNDTKAIATILKDKIISINASQKNTFQAKKQRNVALANLQKLYSMQPIQNAPSGQSIKLITPDFFVKSKAEHLECDVSKDENEITNSSILRSCKEPVSEKCEDLKVVKEKKDCLKSPETINRSVEISEKSSSSDLEVLLTETVGNSEVKEENVYLDDRNNFKHNCKNYDSCTTKPNVSDPEIQNSIKKVKSWFSEVNKKPKGPVLYLGPVSFKRKDATNRSSPNEIDKKISKPTLTNTQKYIPSKYASELNKMYEERMKNKVIENEKVSWENLETKLKEKDEIIREKSKDSSLASSTIELSESVKTDNS